MKLNSVLGCFSALCLSASALPAQETNPLDQVQKQIKQMQENFERTIKEQQKQIELLNQQLKELQKGATNAVAPEPRPAAEPAPAPASQAASPTGTEKSWTPSQPITIGRAGSAYMNISFDTLMDFGWSTAHDPSQQLNLGDHDPNQRGFTLPNAEMALDGAVDPYFKGFANIVLKLDHDNETDIELEEAYLLSTSLPANLQLKAGQFFANFGRQNPQHPHQWAFVDSPLILTRTFGPDGLRNVGSQVSWLAPTPFYSEAFLGVFNGQGETAFSFRNPGENDAAGVNRIHGRATTDHGVNGLGDLLFVPRVATSFELSSQQTLLAGLSAGFGPNDTGSDRHTQIYGMDLYWKWKPANAREGFPFVSWQTEALYQRFEAAADPLAPTPLPAETLEDYGFYSQLLWGFRPRWVAGLRGEYATGNDGAFDDQDVFRGRRTRMSPSLTWYPSEFSKIRLQYDYDHGEHFGDEHSVWLQLEFLLGAHGAHKF